MAVEKPWDLKEDKTELVQISMGLSTPNSGSCLDRDTSNKPQ